MSTVFDLDDEALQKLMSFDDDEASSVSAPGIGKKAPVHPLSTTVTGTGAAGSAKPSVASSIRTDSSLEWQRAVDLDRPYYIRAEVDFVDFKIRLMRPTHRSAIINRCGPGSSIPSSVELPGNVVSEFVVRIPDATPGCCRSAIANLHRSFPLASEPEIVAVEVSMDFYVPQASIAELGRLTSRLYHFAKDKPAERHRIVNRNGAREVPLWLTDLYESMAAAQHSIYIGFQDQKRGRPADPISYRYYVKTTDMNAAYIPNQYRARMEVTLQHDQVPFRTLDEMDRYSFERLGKHFKFCMVAPEDKLNFIQKVRYCRLSDARCVSKKARPPKGLRYRDRRAERVVFSDPLGGQTHSALTSLTRRWKSSERTYKA